MHKSAFTIGFDIKFIPNESTNLATNLQMHLY
jgi:hypothetical protein